MATNTSLTMWFWGISLICRHRVETGPWIPSRQSPPPLVSLVTEALSSSSKEIRRGQS